MSSESAPSVEDELITKEAHRLYATMFGNLLDDADETPSLICERLFLGSAPDARNLDKLQRYRIKYVLNMTGSASYPADFFAVSSYPYVTLLSLDAHDEDAYDISTHFPVALNFIHKSLQAGDGAVLVHCAAGVSRSAAIVAAYLMAVHQIGATEAVLRVHQARLCACPQYWFSKTTISFRAYRF